MASGLQRCLCHPWRTRAFPSLCMQLPRAYPMRAYPNPSAQCMKVSLHEVDKFRYFV
jgi:squalene cyclase